jgi:tetratricopeptide (TPR) repeat protein
VALVSLNRLSEAVHHLRLAVELKSDFVAARVNLGAVLRLQHRFDDATAELKGALTLDPRNAVAHTNLGGVLAAEGKPREAIAEYRLALDVNPRLLEPLTALAWILATASDDDTRQPAEAVRLAEQADDLSAHRDVTVLDGMAAAYAAADRFAEAIVVEQRALDLAGAAGSDVAVALRSRLNLYRRHQPFRDRR